MVKGKKIANQEGGDGNIAGTSRGIDKDIDKAEAAIYHCQFNNLFISLRFFDVAPAGGMGRPFFGGRGLLRPAEAGRRGRAFVA